MQNIEDIREKYFLESQKLMSELMNSTDSADLVNNKAKAEQLLEKISFLKGISENPEIFTKEISSATQPESIFEEKIVEAQEEKAEVISENIQEEEETEIIEELQEDFIAEATMSEELYHKNVEQLALNEPIIEDRRKIVEFEEKTNSEPKKETYFEESVSHQTKSADKKFKLANIKGLKVVESLFDDDPLEHEPIKEEKNDSGSLVKSNIPTDFMEAEKQKPEFKLDLNDRIAFSKMLFSGSQSELNEAINTLNSFKTLDEAKVYLSEIYYKNNWKKADEYAQRLWTLVENKFL